MKLLTLLSLVTLSILYVVHDYNSLRRRTEELHDQQNKKPDV